jgi:ketosteroid isomerase-like protein
MAEVWRDFLSVWEEYRGAGDEYRELDDERVLSGLSRSSRGAVGVGRATGDTCLVASANVELVRSIHAAWEVGDFSSAEWAHPEIEYVIPDGPSPGMSMGLARMAERFREWASAWEDFRVQAEAYCELDDERVLVFTHRTGRGKTSRLELGQMPTKGAEVFHVRGGNVTRLVLYWDRGRALEALGLDPEASSRRR